MGVISKLDVVRHAGYVPASEKNYDEDVVVDDFVEGGAVPQPLVMDRVPDDNLPNPRGQKFWLLVAGIGFLVGGVIAAAIVVPVFVLSSDNKNADNAQSEMFEERQDIISSSDPPEANPLLILSNLPESTLDALNDPHSAQAEAFEWTIRDPNLDSYDDWRIRQRYALAVFYYAFKGHSWGTFNLMSYHVDECRWFRVTQPCDDKGHITKLDVAHHSGLKGIVPPELAMLTKLQILDMSGNLLAVSLQELLPHPRSLPASLEYFYCTDCSLVGSIPSSVVSDTLARMTNLRGLLWNDNGLTGSLPTEVGMLSHLEILQLRKNKLSGSIKQVGALKTLHELDLRENQDLANGTFPVNLCRSNHTAKVENLYTDWCEGDKCCQV